MLEQMHKHMKWIMWTIVVLVTVTFLFFGIYPSTMSGSTVAKVDGYAISSEEFNQVYRNMYENYRQILKDQFTDSFAQTIRKQALQELIQNRLLIQESERRGFKIGDDELQSYIMQMPAFNNQGRFDQRIYERTLQNVNITPAVFEANQREFLLRQKLERLIEDNVVVTEQELAAAYKVDGYPTIWFIDAKGQKIAPLPGYTPPEDFKPVLTYISGGSYSRGITYPDYLKSIGKGK